MNLTFDIGNTRTKWGLFDGTELIETGQESQDLSMEFFAQRQKQLQADRLIIGSVRKLKVSLLEEIKSDADVLLLTHMTPLPIKLAYESRETLGVDRISAAVAGAAMFPGENVLVIDAGTCITYELITKAGVYLGGTIAPGIQMRLNAMHHFTGQLPSLKASESFIELGTDTNTSMCMGAERGAALEVNGFIRHYRERFDNLKVILTGGDHGFFEQHAENAIFAAPNLILSGLNEILLHNKQHP